MLSKRGFSLVEVVLAIGILSLAILSLLGLFGPTMTSVRNVIDKNEATGIMTKINTEIQSDGLQLIAFTRGLSMFDAVNIWATNGQVFYFWTEQDIQGNELQTAEIQIGDNKNDIDIENINSSGVFVVVLSEANLADYSYANNSNEAYVPVQVSIYSVPVDRLLQDSFRVSVNGNGLNSRASDGISDGDLLISYTTARLR